MLGRTATISILTALALVIMAAGPPAEAPSPPDGMDDATRAQFNALPAEVRSDITENIVPGLVSE